MSITLGNLTERAGLEVLDLLSRETAIPVIAGLQAQGDLLVLPLSLAPDVAPSPTARWQDVPGTGIELLRSSAGGNPHTLIADPGTCRWTTSVRDSTSLALGILDAQAPAYLLHAEHGGTGIATGTYAIRRQRERAGGQREQAVRLVAD